MKKRLLIIGPGQGAVSAALIARDMGVEVIEHSLAAGEELVEIARTVRVAGILPTPEPATLSVARAAAQLGFPGVAPETAERLCDKSLVRQALDAAGIPNPKFRVARTINEATASAHELGLPLVVKPADSFGGIGARGLEHIEDLPLLFTQAYRLSANKTVLLESVLGGPEFCIDAIVRNREFTVTGITGKIKAPSPFCYDTGIFTPPGDDIKVGGELFPAYKTMISIAEMATQAFEISNGAISIDVLFSAEGPQIADIAPYPSFMRTPLDITAIAMNNSAASVTANAIRFALGDTPVVGPLEQAAALCWLPTHSGIVKEIEGYETARAIQGVQEIRVGLKPGDRIGHMTDCLLRDQVGYVLTTGRTVEDAIQTARQAMNACRIITSQAL